jgi:hypothetical protein
MSASDPTSSIFVTDSDKQIKDKVWNKISFFKYSSFLMIIKKFVFFTDGTNSFFFSIQPEWLKWLHVFVISPLSV